MLSTSKPPTPPCRSAPRTPPSHAEPPRRPAPCTSARRWLVARAAIVLGATMLGALAPAYAPAAFGAGDARGGIVTSEVTVRNAGLALPGLVVAPAGARGRPGVVLVHGAGPRTRADLRREAEEFPRRGVVALIHDKRTRGYSVTERSFADLAGDELAALRLLRDRPEVDPGRAGLWGFSEGGWVAPLAASRSADVRFLITVGAGGYAPERVQVWSNAEQLAHAGLSGAALDHLSLGLTRVLIAGNAFGAAGYDPAPALRRVRRPVLALWGTEERVVPPAEGAQVLRETRPPGAAPRTIRFVEEAGHDLRRVSDPTGPPSAEAFDLMARWITTGGVAGETGGFTGTAPVQERPSRAPAPAGWAESPWVQLGTLGLLVLGFAAHLAVPLLRASRPRLAPADTAGDRGARRTRRLIRIAAAAGLATVLGTTGYLGHLTLTGAAEPGAVLLGRPTLWLALQLLAAATIATTAYALVRTRPRAAGYATLLTTTALFAAWSAYWGLLTL